MAISQDQINQGIREALSSRMFVQAAPQPVVNLLPPAEQPAQSSDFWGAFVGTVVLVATLICGSIVAYKVATKQPEPKKQIALPQYATMDDLASSQADVLSEIQKIDARLNLTNRRVWILGLANNENAALSNKIDQQLHGQMTMRQDGGYISIDQKWNLNREPRTMKLTEEEKQQLKGSDKWNETP